MGHFSVKTHFLTSFALDATLHSSLGLLHELKMAHCEPEGLLIKTALYANDMKNCLRDNHSRLNGVDYTKFEEQGTVGRCGMWQRMAQPSRS